ncbi:ABC transporter ATP-binding protein [Rheinheimera maricola]|uniref:ABC transporter ATP-binding protein n=1 Tax=Rheinheimera maricola TaxID=2793282 RepID=A0ABS7XDI8_9GAMM|nr:ABC transporter ATP-binding protein [Rheinheimera maricola]MBZ9613214.1 ABC transporter ATP-binding protein [Rheinheimera maricola]
MQANTEAVLAVNTLHKAYNRQPVLQGVSVDLAAGEILAILGPNGAGKTTLISAILGLVKVDGGDISLFGQRQQGSKRSSALRQRLGVMMQIGTASANLTVAEQCDLFASYYRNGKTVAELLQIAGLQAQAHNRFGLLSGGQKQRLLFALALAGKPDLVFLDEPTLGMDVQARRALWQQIRELKQSGVSIVLTTHYLEEAEQLADSIAVLQGGQIVAQGSPAQLTAQISGKQIYCHTLLSDQQLLALPAVVQLERQQHRICLVSQAAEQTVLALLQADANVSALEVKAVALEQAFLQLTTQEEVA